MSDKKHIDRIFQEKFKDFEVSPKPEVWNGIQNKLNQQEKDNKKIFPLWLRLAGVAALLLLMFTVGSLVFNNTTEKSNNTKVVDTEKSTKDTTSPSLETDINSTIVNSNNTDNNLETDSNSQLNSNLNNPLESSNNTQIASENTTESIHSLKNINASKNNSNTTQLENKTSLNNSNDTRITQNIDSKNNLDTNASPTKIDKKKNIENSNRIAETQNTEIINESNSIPEFDDEKAVDQIQQLQNNATENGVAEEENTEAEIEETVEEELNKTDLTIEEAIAANEDIIEKEEEELINRWQVYANVAPVYYNSMGKGSHIDGQFSNNSKTGEVNTSYGVNVSYNLNKKLSIRTGISSLNLSYDTNDVILYENISGSIPATNPLKNINLSSGNESLTALSADNIGVFQVDNALSPQSNAAISQRISYYEIPMEVNYRIGNRKLGLNVIAGFSSFILDDNEVFSELKDEKTYIGEANNIKSFSFSTNFGVGLDYKFSEKVKFNLEPTFKYQINAFENTSGNFNPYIIGIYTGLSYKF
ncbi:porin family protein [Xanthomarina spongicola]|uniref:Uncharacterized protein n=1 Tax=Xanthomarina spongicola TaxID=570520 RepID=A0A316DT35_9FLAO|nr:outer membrane beta-barrel protein [Xanthomarina spongicola]PWK20628.1 hypothetical protein LX78_00330 [Xanthomarina spongicola]